MRSSESLGSVDFTGVEGDGGVEYGKLRFVVRLVFENRVM